MSFWQSSRLTFLIEGEIEDGVKLKERGRPDCVVIAHAGRLSFLKCCEVTFDFGEELLGWAIVGLG